MNMKTYITEEELAIFTASLMRAGRVEEVDEDAQAMNRLLDLMSKKATADRESGKAGYEGEQE
jgi:hypothetical protein